MNYIDIIILVLLIYALIKGILKGFVLQFFSLVGIFIGIYIAKVHINTIALVISAWTQLELAYAKPIAYLIIFLVVITMSHFVAKIIDKSFNISLLKWVNNLLGASLGLLKYVLMLSILLNVMEAIDTNNKLISMESKNKSSFYSPILQVVPKIMPFIQKDFLKN